MASLFTDTEKELIKKAILDAEEKTSGEIRVYFEKKCAINPYERALKIFHELKMEKTDDRNGVLFYLAYEDKKFAIIGDEGIHLKVQQNFWDEVKVSLTENFSKGLMVAAMVKGIEMAGEKLRAYFPYNNQDKNELLNDIVIKD